MTLANLVFAIGAFAALLLYAWMEGLWSWRKPAKGVLDLEVTPDILTTQEISTDIGYIEGKKK